MQAPEAPVLRPCDLLGLDFDTKTFIVNEEIDSDGILLLEENHCTVCRKLYELAESDNEP